jgi:hypothetical protein
LVLTPPNVSLLLAQSGPTPSPLWCPLMTLSGHQANWPIEAGGRAAGRRARLATAAGKEEKRD